MFLGLATILILGQFAPARGDESVAATELRVAQAFRVPDDSGSRPASKAAKKPAKKPAEKKEIKTEEDLWSAPEEPSGEQAEPEIEQVDPDQIEDLQPADRAAVKPKKPPPPEEIGGWGKEVERDTWGDEHLQDQKPLEPDPDAVQPGKTPAKPDGGTADRIDGASPAAQPAADAGVGPGADGVAPAESDATLASQEALIVPSGTLADLGPLWEHRRVRLEQRDFELARQDLARLVRLRRELAIANLPMQSLALLREARRAEQREETELAGFLLDTAVELAPDLPEAHLERTRFLFSQDPLGLGPVIGGLSDSASAALRNPVIKNRMLVNLVISLLAGLGLAILLFSLVQLMRYVKLFLHDFHHLFPRGVAPFQTGLLGVLILLLPVFFRTGLVVIVLAWLLVAWIYQNWRERALTLMAMVLLAGAPFGLWYGLQGLSRPNTTFGDLVDVVAGPAPERSVRQLKAALAEQPTNSVILGALGGHYKRQGRLEQAEQYYRRAVQIEPNSDVFLNNLGNVLFLRDDTNGALAYYERATKARPDQVVPYFNLSRAYFRNANLDKGKESANQAIRLDQQRVREMRELADSRMANYAVVDLAMPSAWIERVDGRKDTVRVERAVESLWRASAGSRSLMAFWITSAVVVVLFVLLLLVRARLFSSKACVRCGRPACRTCTPELRDDTICGQCFHTFVKKSQVDVRTRIAKEIQIRHFRGRTETFARGISFVLPGLGQLLKGRTLRGGLILLVFCLVLMQVLLGGYTMRDPLTPGSLRNWFLLIPMFVFFSGFYVWAILDAFRTEDY